MLKIGITGGIGSGKTTICKVFELLGVPVFYADAAAKAVMQSDRLLIDQVKAAFGNESYADGKLNRAYLASKVFTNPAELEKLNTIVHPAVFRAFDVWASDYQTEPYVLKEAALLYESSSYKDCRYSILVTSPLDLKIKRVMQRDQTTEEEIKKRIARQWSDDEKQKLADFMLENDEANFLIPQILELHQRFLEESIR